MYSEKVKKYFENPINMGIIENADSIGIIENEVKNMSQLGYSVYPRNSSDEIYDIDNITEFFIGEDNALYVIFAYGNQNNTSEMDIVVL